MIVCDACGRVISLTDEQPSCRTLCFACENDQRALLGYVRCYRDIGNRSRVAYWTAPMKVEPKKEESE